MDLLTDPFIQNAFMQRALIAGILVAIATGVVGTLMVLRGMAFLGDALAHGVLPGVAGALLIGIPSFIGALAGAAVMIGGVTVVMRRTRLSSDVAIGLLFVGMLALGVVMVSRSSEFVGSLTDILFGEVLGVGWTAIMWQTIVAIVVIVLAWLLRRPFLLMAMDPDQARVAGYRIGLLEAVFLGMIAVTVVASFSVVGTLLVFGMLLAPAGTAALLTRRVGTMMVLSAAVGSVSAYVGLVLSWHLDLAAGATIVLVAVATFFFVLVVQGLVPSHRSHSEHA
ncbi:MAG: metal ABC transporter permease [Thermoleophilia bacterium]|nr:metal ABC transporter permease [Thermoleophilia bacterium]